ncbi:lipid IV(A) 3-deoxy-D-manno-octulosonic acid transferase [Vibrio sp. D404a]|uniref:lipid IV(A) 3-deoxy-D-manno-octulosonic acid transferase n=1 Tax=unclassified Vibrio TaxID=2614977 RepID=UPI002556E0A5|nr:MULTISPECIES: lipid IV(A) 3-deoxy-D-manno-octulosonic acid transferase [unclassified Vibrio]MDK9737757.1 lipid IV(A) 3-deoxy-D-manno-octulosonic acid transferase [Vibrio sp. D404a]MDK9795359.1 lipid IV(A) 3-deoxy-D-manno-octulosonic acid transferase [Vibrio sp. D449a]
MLIRAVYTLLLALAAPLLLFNLYKSKPNKPKFGSRWKEHFGLTPKLNSKQPPIWIHAVSVGESIAAVPLIKELKKQQPEQPIVVTTTTSTGAQQIEKLGDLVEHRYMPIDFAFAIRGFINTVQPKEMLIIETELWPNTLHFVHKSGIPITIVNARLSEKSYKNYLKIQALFNLLHTKITKILCQTESDATRFKNLGVAKEKITVTGSIKFDIEISNEVKVEGKALREKLGITRPVWIAASTHKGEDEQVLEAHKQVLESHPDALLALVPRHPERFDNVFELCEKLGFETARRTTQDSKLDTSTQVYLADTMGELLVIIAAADLCFVGGSLVGDRVGGHNVLEPVSLGVPVINGDSYFNFSYIVETLLSKNAIQIVSSSQELRDAINELLSNKELRPRLKASYNEFLQNELGSISKTIQAINEK